MPNLTPLPTGVLTVNCNGTQQVATFNFNDPDGTTTATLSIGGTTLWTGTDGSYTVNIPTSLTNAYPPSQTVTLYIPDVGTLAPPGANTQYFAQTDVPCVTSSCGNMSYTPNPLDPYMTFSVTVNVNVSSPP